MNGGTSKSINVWEAASTDAKTVYYVVRHPWEWVMEDLTRGLKMKPVENARTLPLAVLMQQSTQEGGGSSNSGSPSGMRRSRRSARGRPKGSQGRASLRLEVVDTATGKVELAAHGTSACFEGLGDKDELVRTIQRCRCESLNLSPPSILLQWDITKQECHNVVGTKLPALPSASSDRRKATTTQSTTAVLKEPMGSQGKGIYFVHNAEDIYEIVDNNRKRASEDPHLLDTLIAEKGRIPSWVLQAEVYPSLLIRDRRKFHIRTYLLVLERSDDEVLDMLIYSRHEVRIAGLPVDENEEEGRNPLAHITNGALSGTTSRVLLNEVPELVNFGLQQKLELFVAEIFGRHLLSDISRRINTAMAAPPAAASGHGAPPIREFAVAGLDLMVTQDMRLYLLEANVNPAAPRQSLCDDAFSEHLRGFFRDMVNVVTQGVQQCRGSNFIDAFEILERQAASSSNA